MEVYGDELPAALYDGVILCQVMNLYLRENGRPTIAVKRAVSQENAHSNLRFAWLFLKPLICRILFYDPDGGIRSSNAPVSSYIQ